MKWFRWYRGTSEDPKMRVVARLANLEAKNGLSRPVTVRDAIAMWALVLEDASKEDHRGVCVRPLDYICEVLDLDGDTAMYMITAMEATGLVKAENATMIVINWHKLQFETDSRDPTAAERQRRYRAKTKHNGDVTVASRPANAALRPDTDTDTESKNATESEFEAFWSAYPRKVAKPEALKAFKRALKKTTLPVLLAALGSIDRSDPKFIPHAATWLNQERWADEKPKANGSTPIRSEADEWRSRLAKFKSRGLWLSDWGPPPGRPYCDVPSAILQEFGLAA